MSTDVSPNVSFDILLSIKEKQAANGTGYGDYERYRQHCASKLRKLRQNMGITHGKGGLRKKPLPVKKLTQLQKLQQQQQLKKSKSKSKSKGKQQGAVDTREKEKEKAVKGRKAIERHRKEQEGKKKAPSKEEQATAFRHRHFATVEDFFQKEEVVEDGAEEGETEKVEGSDQNKQREMSENVAIKIMLIPLLQAERAWSYAMQLKQEYADDTDEASRKKFHYMKRLKKAAMWSDRLEKLCAELGDQRTHLEAQAYNHWIQGTLLLELEKWKDALEKFLHARTIYDNMGQVGRVTVKEAFRQRVQEIDLSVRLCKYNLDRTSVDSKNIVSEMESQASPTLDILKSKLDQALEETRKAQAKNMEEIEWSGRSIVVDNEKVRLSIVSARSLHEDVSNCKTTDAKLRIYDKILLALSDCQKLIREDMKANENRTDEQIADIRFLHSYVSFLSLQRTVERNLVMAEQLEERLSSKQSKEEDARSGRQAQKRAKKSTTSSLDIVHLLDVVLQNVEDLKQLPGVEGDENLLKRLNCQTDCYRASRCYHLGEGLAQAGEWKKAYALHMRATQLVEIAKKSLREHDQDFRAQQPDLDKLLDRIRISQFHANSQFVIQQQQEQEQDQSTAATTKEKMDTVNARGKRDVLSHLDEFEVDARGRVLLASFPPNFETAPSKPVFFDIANNSIQYPDVRPKMGQEEEKQEPKKKEAEGKKRGWFGLW